MLKLIPDVLKLPLAGLAGALLCFSVFALANTIWLLPAARQEGRVAERADALQRSMDLIKQRGNTNAEINKLDDAGICRKLRGHWLPDEKRCE